jgi:hexosaminidase
MAPNNFLYFNRAITNGPGQPLAPPRPPISLETVYNFDPVPSGLSPAQQQLILGAEACLWTERLNKSEWLETMTYPRLCALAEVDWSRKSVRDWSQFSQRMETHRKRLDIVQAACLSADKTKPKMSRLSHQASSLVGLAQ